MSSRPEPLPSSETAIEPERREDAPAIQALVLAAFGPGRFAKTAERVRESSSIAAGFVVRQEGRVVGSVRLWSIRIGAEPALFLGPIAVDAAFRSAGLGQALVQACVAWSRSAGASGVLLIGDASFFERLGFARAVEMDLPGPVDGRRLLWWGLGGEAPNGRVTGVVSSEPVTL